MKKWTDELWQRALELSHLTFKQIAQQLNDEFNLNLTTKAVKRKFENMNVRKNIKPNTSITINNDGSQASTIKLRMTAEQAKSHDYVLKAHGYDSDEWEIERATSNIWEQNNAIQGLVQLYQSKIIVKPKKQLFKIDDCINRINSNIKLTIKTNQRTTGERYLVVPLFDLHFGNNSLADYEQSLSEQLSIISKGYKEILIILGGDLLHNDNHRGMTSSGTVIDKVDMTQAWTDSFDYMRTIVESSLSSADNVKLLYVPGNHDEITGQTVVLALDRVFKDNRLTIDSEHNFFKAILLGHNFIGATHGDRSTWKKYVQVFAVNFATLWGADNVRTREVYSGHLHFEAYKDMDGLMIRQSPTRNKVDGYHRDNGFNMAHKRFELVEYDEYEVRSVYYV